MDRRPSAARGSTSEVSALTRSGAEVLIDGSTGTGSITKTNFRHTARRPKVSADRGT
jgi:hypothetical protein